MISDEVWCDECGCPVRTLNCDRCDEMYYGDVPGLEDEEEEE